MKRFDLVDFSIRAIGIVCAVFFVICLTFLDSEENLIFVIGSLASGSIGFCCFLLWNYLFSDGDWE